MKKIILLLFLSISSFAQVVYQEPDDDVYNFLSRLSQKGIIRLDDVIRPLSRKYLAGKLLEAKADSGSLTPLEKEVLEFLLKDYYHEIVLLNGNNPGQKKLNYPGRDNSGRYRLFSYTDNLFKLNLSPVFGYETGSRDKEKYTHSWSGVNMYGYLSDIIGFSFYFRDNKESGKTIDRTKNFSPVTGVTRSTGDNNSFQYSEARTTIATDWSWGSVSIGKDFLEWGYGRSGNIVLSQKAPSFPFIRLDIKPVDWLSFNYFHAWLRSDVIDSSEIYSSLRNDRRFDRAFYREKYLASHSITVTPLKGLDVSLGESVVYSDRLEIAYMFPLMFYRAADHYLSKNTNSLGSNSQFFFNVSSRGHLKNTHLYSSLFIDEITLEGAFDKQKQRNQFGFMLGGSVADLPLNNLTFICEYTKIFPFVYRHYIPTQTYENAGYTLGHWMGHNSDMVYASLNYRFIRGLQATLWGEYIRKGGDGVVDQQYTQPQSPFLFGLKNKFTYGGLDVKYEIIHEAFLRGRFVYNKSSMEQENGTVKKGSFNEFYMALYYGL